MNLYAIYRLRQANERPFHVPCDRVIVSFERRFHRRWFRWSMFYAITLSNLRSPVITTIINQLNSVSLLFAQTLHSMKQIAMWTEQIHHFSLATD